MARALAKWTASAPVSACEEVQLTGAALDGCGELDRTRGRPVALPGLLGRVKIVITEVVVAAGGGKRGAHLGIGQPTCDGGVTSVP
jgi:hypothetical protein